MVQIKRSDSSTSSISASLKIVLKFIVDKSSNRRREDVPSVRMSDLLNTSTTTRYIETDVKCSSFSEENPVYNFTTETNEPKSISESLKNNQKLQSSSNKGSSGKTKKIKIKIKVSKENESNPMVSPVEINESQTFEVSAEILKATSNQKSYDTIGNATMPQNQNLCDEKIESIRDDCEEAVLSQNQNLHDEKKTEATYEEIENIRFFQKQNVYDEKIQSAYKDTEEPKIFQNQNISAKTTNNMQSPKKTRPTCYSLPIPEVNKRVYLPNLNGSRKKNVEYFVPKASEPHGQYATLIHDLVLEKFKPFLRNVFKKPIPTCYYPTVIIDNVEQMVDKCNTKLNEIDITQSKTEEVTKHGQETKINEVNIIEEQKQDDNIELQRYEKELYSDESDSPILNQTFSVNTPSWNWVYSTDSGINTSGEKNEDILGVLNEQEEIEYDEQKFLTAALSGHASYCGSSSNGDHNNPFPLLRSHFSQTDYSIGTDNISSLISSSSETMSSRRRKSKRPCVNSIESLFKKPVSYQGLTCEAATDLNKRESLYSTIRKPKNVKDISICNISNFERSLVDSSFASYKEVVDSYEEKAPISNSSTKGTIFEEILRQSETNTQASKALQFGVTQDGFLGTVIHLELEKILLVSSIKKEVFTTYINKSEYETMDEVKSYGSICIQNLKYTLNSNNSNHCQEFYICILKSENTVHASAIVTPNKNRIVLFKEEFMFTRLKYDFQIDIILYCLEFSSSRASKSHCFTNPRKLLQPYNYQTFNLLEKTNISVDNVSKEHFMLQKDDQNNSDVQNMNADISCKVNITTGLRGFLTVATECRGMPMWNRRWCVLERFILKYFNYPSDEYLGTPVGVIDLKYCINQRVDSPNESVCPRYRTLLVEILKYNVKTSYLICADTQIDYEMWKKQLNGVLEILTNWKLR